MLRRFKIENTEVFEEFYNQGRSIILSVSHYNNWELLAKSINHYTSHQAICIYSPLRDKFCDKKLKESRSLFGLQMLSKSLVSRSFIANRDKLTMTLFAADQSPTFSKNVYWGTFLNQETSFHLGTEIFAVKYNYPVVYIKVNKVKRGYYSCELEVLHENPASTTDGEITELHAKCLEKLIMENPPFWLWSHKRWKRKMTDEERQALRKTKRLTSNL